MKIKILLSYCNYLFLKETKINMDFHMIPAIREACIMGNVYNLIILVPRLWRICLKFIMGIKFHSLIYLNRPMQWTNWFYIPWYILEIIFSPQSSLQKHKNYRNNLLINKNGRQLTRWIFLQCLKFLDEKFRQFSNYTKNT